MQVKLTVRISDRIIRQAKTYARKHKISVSKLIEKQLQEICADGWEPKEVSEFSPSVKSLIGILKGVKPAELKKTREDYLLKKHLK